MKNLLIKNLFFFLSLMTTMQLTAQVVKFEKVYGNTGYEYGYSVVQTYDKGYAMAGATSSFGNGNTDAYLLKVDSLGAIQFQKMYGGVNIDQAYCIKQTADSGLIMAGYTNSFGNGGYDMYVNKTDALGNVTWSKTYGGTNWDFAYSIQQTTDGGYIIAGGTSSYGNGNEDMYLVKINAKGDTSWTKTYGGSEDDEARSVKQTKDGGYILTGYTKSFGDSLGDIFTVKTNSIGDTLWTYTYKGATEDFSFDIIESIYNKYIIAGKTKRNNTGDFDGVTIELTLSGKFKNMDYWGGPKEDGIQSITESPTGRVAIAGYTTSFGMGGTDFLLYLMNPYNSATFGQGNMEKAFSINKTSDGGYIICGTSNSFSPFDHIYLVKTDSSGVSSGKIINVITNINTYSKISSKYTVYPNPTKDKININTIAGIKIKSLTIKDILGKAYPAPLITVNQDKIEVDCSFLKNGMYFISIENNYSIDIQRIIIQH
ncbi:MAG: T9SS type A sorting domain-containing protein [Bacteroidia bacterium]